MTREEQGNRTSRSQPCGAPKSAATEAVSSAAGELDEPVLPDDYPIYAGYLYVADGRVIQSDYHGVTARQLRGRMGIKELRRCDIYGRAALRKAEGQ